MVKERCTPLCAFPSLSQITDKLPIFLYSVLANEAEVQANHITNPPRPHPSVGEDSSPPTGGDEKIVCSPPARRGLCVTPLRSALLRESRVVPRQHLGSHELLGVLHVRLVLSGN